MRHGLRHPVDMQTGRASPQYCVRSDKLGSASEYITVPALAIGLLIVSGYLWPFSLFILGAIRLV